jgi:hypothetical protein
LRQFAAIAYRNGCTLQQLFSDVAYMSKVNDAYVGVSYQKHSHQSIFNRLFCLTTAVPIAHSCV